MNSRIKKVRRFFDLTQQAFAERIGLKQNTIALIESGKRSTSDQTIYAICREFGVNETWLRTGEGEMMDPQSDDALENLAREKGLSRAEIILIEKFLNLKPEVRRALVDYAVSVSEALRDVDPDEAEAEAVKQEYLLQKRATGESSATASGDGEERRA